MSSGSRRARPENKTRHTKSVAPDSSNSLSHGSKCTLTAAALQDHLSRKYSLSLACPTAKTQVRLQAKQAQSKGKCSGCGVGAHKQNESKRNPESRKKEVEYTLDKAPPPLSLAQRMGLVGAPPGLLTEHKWEEVKQFSNERQDSALPCPICQESFALSTQVLLSCSHVFHLSCLTAFERFSRKKHCPLCRTQNYQRRVIYEGSQHWKHKAATIIQCCWRGYVVRRWYGQYKEKVPPSHAHPQLRARHFEKRLSMVTERIVQSCNRRSDLAEQLLADCDSGISLSRDAMRLCELHLTTAQVDWELVRTRASQHLSTDCSVCLCPLRMAQQGSRCVPKPHPQRSLSNQQSKPRPLSVLSCGHLLHEVCIEALERFAGDETAHLCPLCRTPYQRQKYAVNPEI